MPVAIGDVIGHVANAEHPSSFRAPALEHACAGLLADSRIVQAQHGGYVSRSQVPAGIPARELVVEPTE